LLLTLKDARKTIVEDSFVERRALGRQTFDEMEGTYKAHLAQRKQLLLYVSAHGSSLLFYYLDFQLANYNQQEIKTFVAHLC